MLAGEAAFRGQSIIVRLLGKREFQGNPITLSCVDSTQKLHLLYVFLLTIHKGNVDDFIQIRMTHCKWGNCNSNYRYRNLDHMKDVTFIPFPKPCKYFRAEIKDPTILVWHDRTTCEKCSLCMEWIRACKVEGFSNLEQITSNSYVCSKHFVDGKPTEQHPIPITAGSFGNIIKRRKLAPRRYSLPAEPSSSVSVTETTPSIQPTTISPSKDCLKRKLEESEERCASYKSKIKVLQQKVRRQSVRLQACTQLLDDLRDKDLINETLRIQLGNTFAGMTFSVIENELNNRDSGNHKFSKDLKEFAQTLYYLSPRAYKYARRTLTLPHKSTIRRWMSCDGVPGWTRESFDALNSSSDWTDCVLIIDGMHIKSASQFSSSFNRFFGYVDFGCDNVDSPDDTDLATEALFMMAVHIFDYRRVPLGYFLTCGGATAEQQKNLLKDAFERLKNCGIRVRALVFDGTSTNIATAKLLGAVLPDTPYFPHPYWPQAYIYVALDISHMIKLARNAFAKGVVCDENGSEINWHFVRRLYQIQEAEGLRLANRLTRAHVLEWFRYKMKVRLAVQVLSDSVADALQFLSSREEFSEVGPTITFIRTMNQLFDQLNSRSPYGRGWKRALSEQNFSQAESELKRISEYLRSLYHRNGSHLMNSSIRTFVLGMITTINSVCGLAREVLEESPGRYFMTYRLSQDPIEHFFGDLRQRGGWCANPTALYLVGSYRAMVHNRLRLYGLTQGRNCEEIEKDDRENEEDNKLEDQEEQRGIALIESLSISPHSEFRENILFYISGWIVRTLRNRWRCEICKSALIASSSGGNVGTLTNIKQRGGLLHPSDSVFRVVKLTDRWIENKLNSGSFLSQKVLKTMETDIAVAASWDCNIFPNLSEHSLDCEPSSVHSILLIKNIAFKFANARLGLHGKQETERIMGAAQARRSQKSRLLIFSNI